MRIFCAIDMILANQLVSTLLVELKILPQIVCVLSAPENVSEFIN